MADSTQPRARVLVVDDNRLIREMASDALSEVAEVECCESGEEALYALVRRPADVIVSDLEMPGISGLELLEQVERRHPGTDFVMLTANATVDSAIGALRLGAADYLRKPLRPEEVVFTVERLIGRRRLLADNERLREILNLVESCKALARCLDAGEVYAVALDMILHALSPVRGLALFRRTAVPMSDAVAFRGFDEDQAGALRETLVSEKPFAVDDVKEIQVLSEGPIHEALRDAGVDCGRVLSVPLVGREAEAGVLWLLEDDPGESFDRAELDRVRIIARHAELALHNAERYSHAKERAFVDDVTEVYNARYLHQAVEHEIQRARRYEKELSILFLDLDRFKLVNDEFGHLVGSQTLRRLAEVLGPCIRQVDTLARYGGDEFTILLVDTAHEAAQHVAERIRKTVADTIFEGGRDHPIKLSISIGVATFPDHGETREEILDAADKAMYRAKSLGRNRVCTASDLV